MSPWLFILLVNAVARGGNGGGTEINIAQISGMYEQPASRCATADPHAPSACLEGATDRLVIQYLSDTHARIVVHSHQVGGHQCHADGVANVTPSGLTYCPEADPGTCLVLTQHAEQLRFNVTMEGDYYVPFCGARATLDGLVIDRRTRFPSTPCPRD
ncbi:MAG: hypothetical protein AB7O21_00120 [Gammaproteobacteria bacterium]